MGANDLMPACGCNDLAGADGRCGGTLPDSPDCAINYHFGMLLGVDDFRTEQGFHLGHHRRHQRALHGHGVVYGFAVKFDQKKGELRVEPGFGVDRHGRDLYLDTAQCLGLTAWWDKHKDEPPFKGKDDVTFDADLVLCSRTCLSRPVPAIADPCAQSTIEIAYSRICESIELTLVPRLYDGQGESSTATSASYHLLRLYFGLDQSQAGDEAAHVDDESWLAIHRDEQWLATQRDQVLALPAGDRLAATEKLLQQVIARAAAATSDPGGEDTLRPPTAADDGSAFDMADCFVIARLKGVRLVRGDKGWQAAVEDIDIGDRATLLPTQVLQALLAGAVAGTPGGGEPPVGPVLARRGAAIQGNAITLNFNKPLATASVGAKAFAVTEFDPDRGWAHVAISNAAYTNADHRVTLRLDRKPKGAVVRVTVIGSGPTPLLGHDLTPAGAPTIRSDGTDKHVTIPKE